MSDEVEGLRYRVNALLVENQRLRQAIINAFDDLYNRDKFFYAESILSAALTGPQLTADTLDAELAEWAEQ